MEQEKVYYLVYPTLERMNPNKNIEKIIEKGDEEELEEILLESEELDWV